MSNAFACDRCGSVYKGHPSIRVEWQRVGQGYDLPGNGDLDLCPSCAKRFAESMRLVWEDE